MFYIWSKYSFPKAVIPILHSFLSLRVSTVCVQGSEDNFGNQSSCSILFETGSPLLLTVHTQATWLKSSGKFSCSMCHRGCKITDVSYNIWLYTCTRIQTQVLTIVQQAPSPLSHLLSPPSVSFLVTKSLQLSRSLIAYDAWFFHFCHPNIQGVIMWFKYFFQAVCTGGVLLSYAPDCDHMVVTCNRKDGSEGDTRPSRKVTDYWSLISNPESSWLLDT